MYLKYSDGMENNVDSVQTLPSGTNRIYHWPLMQTEKSQPEGKRIMLETRFTEFPALSVDPRVGISLSTSDPDDWLFLLPIIE